MKRSTTLILCCLFLSGTLFSQEQEQKLPSNGKSRMTLDFFGGYSIPFGKYKSFDKGQPNSGYASGGFLAQLKLNWLGKRDIGLGVSYAFQQNTLQDTAMRLTPNGMDSSFVLGDRPWSNHYILAGPVFVKAFNRWILDLSLLAGFVIATSENFSITIPEDSIHYRISSGAGTGVAFQARASVGYRISNRVILTAGISYLGANPTRKKENYVYSYVEEPPESGNFYPVFTGYEETRKKKISTLNPGLGIIIKL